jgi:hypothetical protein
MNVRMLVVIAASILVLGCGALPSPGSQTARFDMSGLAFDYPAAWQSISVGRVLHYETVIAFLTSSGATASETCGSAYIPGLGGDCSQEVTLPANSVVVKISLWGGPPSGPAGAIAALRAQGWSSTTVGGEPAAFTPQALEGIPGSDRSLVWAVGVPGPDNDQKAYWITAGIRGPDLASIQAQVEAMIATVHVATASASR